jgi:hypothetical protein
MSNPDAEHWKLRYDRLCVILNEQSPLWEAMKVENKLMREMLERSKHWPLLHTRKEWAQQVDAILGSAREPAEHSVTGSIDVGQEPP